MGAFAALYASCRKVGVYSGLVLDTPYYSIKTVIEKFIAKKSGFLDMFIKNGILNVL